MHHKTPTYFMCFLHVHFGTTAFYNENITNEEIKILKTIASFLLLVSHSNKKDQ
jgi:hypothetical protein